MADLPVLQTPRLRLRVLNERSAAAVLDYYRRNRDFHQPWFASRDDDIFTLRQQQANLAVEYSDFLAGRAVPFWLSTQSEPQRIIGRFAFTNIVRGCFHSCFAAYHLDEHSQGIGLAFEAGQTAIRSIFDDFCLHRIEANIMPANSRSIALATRLGFLPEGLSPRYLEINGKWEDHLHYVRFADGSHEADTPQIIETDSWLIRPLHSQDIQPAMQYYQRNRDQIDAWNPTAVSELQSEADWHKLFNANLAAELAGRRLDLGLFYKDRPHWLAGTIECTNILPLPWSSCEIGYSIDRLLSGRGLMLEALSAVTGWLFARYSFQRIIARCAAGNERSLKLLGLLGFEQEGLEKRALWLHESWQDLIRMSLYKI